MLNAGSVPLDVGKLGRDANPFNLRYCSKRLGGDLAMKSAIALLVVMIVALTSVSGHAQTAAGPVVITNSGHSDSVTSLAFALNGQWLATGSTDSTIKLWDPASGRLLRTLRGHSSKINATVLTPDGRNIVSVSEDNTIKVWEPETGKLVRTIGGVIDANNDALREGLALSSDGRSVYSVSINAIRRFDLTSGSLQQQFSKPGQLAFWQAFTLSADSRLIAAAHEIGPCAGMQVKLLDAANGRVVRTLATFSLKKCTGETLVTVVSFSPDGRLIAAGGREGIIRVWDVASGRLLHALAHSESKESKFVFQVKFSPDSRTIATVGGPDGVKFWDASTGRIIRTMGNKGYQWSQSIGYSPDGRSFVIGNGTSRVILTDAVSGTPSPVSFGQNDTSPPSITPLAPGRWLEGRSKGFTVWDENGGQLVQTQDVEPGDIDGSRQFAAKRADGHVLIAARGKKFSINVWDATQGSLLRSIDWTPAPLAEKPCPTCSPYYLDNISISPDGRWLAATLYGDPASGIRIWDVATGQQVKSIATGAPLGGGSMWAAISVAFSPDGQSLLAGVFDSKYKYWLRTWDVGSGRQTSAFALLDQYAQASVGQVNPFIVSFAPDGRSVALQYTAYVGNKVVGATEGAFNSIATLDPTNGQSLRRFLHDQAYSSSSIIRYSPDGRLILVGLNSSELVLVWEAATGRLVRALQGNSGTARSIAFSSDGRRVIVGNSNGTASVWSLDTFERLATKLHVHSGEWVTITPEGFFVASAQGAELLHVVQGFNTIGIEQVYQALYRPDLVREKLAGDSRGLVRLAAAQLDLTRVIGSGLAPDVRLTLPGRALGQGSVGGDSAAVEAEIIDRGGGIGRVEWRVNGVTAGVDSPSPAPSGQTARLTRSLALDPGTNEISVVAYNSSNLIASVPARASVATAPPTAVPPAPSPGATQPLPAPVAGPLPRLFVLVAGVNDYAEKRIKLAYAVSDAKDVARGFQEASGNLYQSVEVKLLTDGEVTHDRIGAAFAEMAGKATTSDMFVLYLAGHGKTVDGRYYFIPQDFAVDGEFNDKAIDAAVKVRGIAQEQWQKWFASVPARRSVILFDTCDSGTLAGDETQELERGAANDRLAHATGRSILTASGGAQEAIEGYRGHGLFTYNVLDAIYRSDGDNSGTIELNELAAYVYGQVSELSQKVFKQRQVPQMRLTGNYPLAKPTRILMDEATPVAESRPTYQVAQSTQLQVQPNPGATVVRSLAASTKLIVLESKNGWSLVAADGKPLGYVATKDLDQVK